MIREAFLEIAVSHYILYMAFDIFKYRYITESTIKLMYISWILCFYY